MWTLEELERYHIQRAFERNHGRRESTARQLGISVRTLYRKLRKYRIID
jgi:DNA-binding NtrC family response regulator